MKRYLISLFLVLAIGGIQSAFSQTLAVKSNVLYDLTGSLNVGGEYFVNDKHTFQLGVTYNPWEWGENKKMKHLLVQPEYRYWLEEAFFGTFVGFEGHAGMFNFGSMTPFTTIKNNRYQGKLVGCGLTFGHQWMLGTFWSLEASVGLGYTHLSYDKYGPAKGDYLIEKSKTDFFGPTQLGITLVYFIP